MGTVPPQCIARAAAGFYHLVVLAGRGENRAADQAYLRGALPAEQAVDDAEQEVLCTRLHVPATLLAEDVGKYGSGAEGFIYHKVSPAPRTNQHVGIVQSAHPH